MGYSKDRRDSASTYMHVHNTESLAERFTKIPVGHKGHFLLKVSGCVGDSYTVCHNGYVTAQRYYRKDRRDRESTYMFVHNVRRLALIFKEEPVTKNLFILKVVGKLGDRYTVSRGYVSAERYYRKDRRDIASTYMDVHRWRSTALLFHKLPWTSLRSPP